MRTAWLSVLAIVTLAFPARACEQSIVSVDSDWSIATYAQPPRSDDSTGRHWPISERERQTRERMRGMFRRDGSRLTLPYRNIGERPFLRAEVSVLFHQGAHGRSAPLVAEWDRSLHQAGNSSFSMEIKEDGVVARFDTNLNVALAPGERGTIVVAYPDDTLARAFADIHDETIVTVCAHFVDFGEGEEIIFSAEKG